MNIHVKDYARLHGVTDARVRGWIYRGLIHSEKDYFGRLMVDEDAVPTGFKRDGYLSFKGLDSDGCPGDLKSGMKLGKLMKDLDMNVHELSDRSGVSFRSIYRYIKGTADQNNMRLNTALLLCFGLGVKPMALIDGDVEKNHSKREELIFGKHYSDEAMIKIRNELVNRRLSRYSRRLRHLINELGMSPNAFCISVGKKGLVGRVGSFLNGFEWPNMESAIYFAKPVDGDLNWFFKG